MRIETIGAARVGEFELRPARPEDLDDILGLICQLAEYEGLTHLVRVSRTDLGDALFGPRPAAEVLLAAVGPVAAGFALYFDNFSTFLGRRGLYLEDLFVLPEFRRRGIGRALLVRLAALAVERGYGRFEWTVLDWNQPAIRFYESLGATVMPDWRIARMTGESLVKLSVGGRTGDDE